MLSQEEIDGILSQNEVAILCGCAECGRKVTNEYMLPKDGAVFIRRDPTAIYSTGFPLCGECVRKLVEA